MGEVCAKHNEFYEKECRWCEVTATSTVPSLSIWTDSLVALNQSIWADHLRKVREYGRLMDAHFAAAEGK
jgi:hypothetical protein